MEAHKSVNKIKKLKPTKDTEHVNQKKGKLYKIVSSMYEKDYNLKTDKKN